MTGNVAEKKKPFKKTLYRGFEIDQLLEKNTEEILKIMNARQRRKYSHGISIKYERLVKKIKNSVKETPYGEKPKAVKTHLRNCIITPEMVGGIVDVYAGKYWNAVEIKTDMVGSYLAEFSLSYKPVKHGKVGVGATRGSKFTSPK